MEGGLDGHPHFDVHPDLDNKILGKNVQNVKEKERFTVWKNIKRMFLRVRLVIMHCIVPKYVHRVMEVENIQ